MSLDFFNKNKISFLFLFLVLGLFLVNFGWGDLISTNIVNCSTTEINPNFCVIELDTSGINSINGIPLHYNTFKYKFSTSSINVSNTKYFWQKGFLIYELIAPYTEYNLNPEKAGRIETENFILSWDAEQNDRKTTLRITFKTNFEKTAFDETKFTCVKNEDTSIISIFEMLLDGEYIYTINETQMHFKKEGTDIFICVKNSEVPAPVVTPEPKPLKPSDDGTTPTSNFNFKKFYNGLLEKLLKKKAL